MANDLVVMPETTLDSETGGYVQTNDTILAVNSLQGETVYSMPNLGYVFFSSAYLMVNHDAGKFSLWTAFQTDQEELKAVDELNEDIVDFCPATEGEKVDPTPEKSERTGSSGRNVGAIAGGVVGGVVAVSVAMLVVWLIRRRRNRSSGVGNAVGRSAEDFSTMPSTLTSPKDFYKPQGQGFGPPIRELDGQPREIRRHELA